MKTARLPFAFALGSILLFATARAAEPSTLSAAANNTAMERAVMHQINRRVIFPLSAENGEMFGTVDVSFAVDVNGRLVVKEARSDNAALRDYVVRKLGRIKVEANPSGLWNTTHLRFIFKPEKQEL